MPTFAVRGLTHRFGSVLALDHIDLDVADGEFLVILGPSGSGKSTLLEILAGLQEPSAGEVVYDGGPATEIGMVFQDPALYPWRTVGRNVGIGLELDGVPAAERSRRVDAQLAEVGLTGLANTYPHQLSGGMRQRAGLARALVRGPRALLMDEPYGAVDHITRIQLQQDLLRLWSRDRTTVVFVTHDVGEAVFLADRIVLLTAHPGRVFREFRVDEPRPRTRGDANLLAHESEVYAALREMEPAANP